MKTQSMTKEEFADQYAERSKLSRKTIDKMFTIAPCHCGEFDCNGWQMVGMFLDRSTEPLGHYP